MPCIVKKTFEEPAAAGALLIAPVKDNQPTLHQCAERVCQTSTPVDQTTTKDAKRRSRDETRIVEVFDPNAALADTEWADHVGAIIRVSRTTHARQRPLEDVQRGRVFRLRVLAARRPLRPGDPLPLGDRKPLPLRPRWQLPRGRQSYSLQSGYLRSPAILCEQHSPFQRRRERVRHSLSHHPRWPRRFGLVTLHVESVEQPWGTAKPVMERVPPQNLVRPGTLANHAGWT
jgi:hypothetical protein